MNNYLLPSILAPACLTRCHSLIHKNKNSKHSSFSLALYSFSSHIFYRLASPSLLSLSLHRRHRSPLMWWTSLLFSALSPAPFEDVRPDMHVTHINPGPYTVIFSILFWILCFLEGGCFGFDCCSVMSWWFHHLKTLLQSHNDQPKSSVRCMWSSNYFPCTSSFTYVEPGG